MIVIFLYLWRIVTVNRSMTAKDRDMKSYMRGYRKTRTTIQVNKDTRDAIMRVKCARRAPNTDTVIRELIAKADK